MNAVRLIQSGLCDAATNMAVDEALFLSYGQAASHPVLRLYGFDPAAFSVGQSQAVQEILNAQACRDDGIGIVRRPTGGGILFHDDEVTYSLILSQKDIGPSLGVKESFETITSFLIDAYGALGLQADFAKNINPDPGACHDVAGFCLSRKELYDILVYGKKLGGNAQKRRKNVILQHGSIPLTLDKTKIQRYGLAPYFFDAVQATSLTQAAGRRISRNEVVAALRTAFCRHFNARLKEDTLTGEEKDLAEELKLNKYDTQGWNGHRIAPPNPLDHGILAKT